MAVHLLVVFLHIMTSILWVGYVLFWTIVAGPIARAGGSSEAARVFEAVNRAPWPPRKIPAPFRFKFSQVGGLLLVVLAITGFLLVFAEGIGLGDLVSGRFLTDRFGRLLAVKLVLVLLLAGLQFRLAARPSRRTAYGNLLGAVIVVVLSALLARLVGK
ncbi:MAG: hypothetical protein FJY73_00465 [Candidatus Eisenbacteria bacterium]|nr:hypothetical protein [Candidatus Eisenbacteria bacterium]